MYRLVQNILPVSNLLYNITKALRRYDYLRRSKKKKNKTKTDEYSVPEDPVCRINYINIPYLLLSSSLQY